jgi:hypothetical protein
MRRDRPELGRFGEQGGCFPLIVRIPGLLDEVVRHGFGRIELVTDCERRLAGNRSGGNPQAAELILKNDQPR